MRACGARAGVLVSERLFLRAYVRACMHVRGNSTIRLLATSSMTQLLRSTSMDLTST